MYSLIEGRIQRAVRRNYIILRTHAQRELRKDHFTFADLKHCLLTGAVVKQQYDADYDDYKYVVYGDALDQRERAAVVRFGYNAEVVVITAYQLRLQDYEDEE